MYILTITKENNLQLLDTSLLSDYVLSPADIQYISNLSGNAAAITANLQADLIAKIGPGTASKQLLDLLYVQIENSQGLDVEDLNNFRKFIRDNLVGNKSIDVTTLKIDEIVE